MIESIQRNMSWGAVLVAGIVAGAMFLLAQLLLMPALADVKGTLFLHYSAALLLGQDALTDGGTMVLVVGLLVHAGLSILFAFVIAVVVHRWGLGVGVIGGAILGAALYSFNLYTVTARLEWFFALHSTALLISHILYGAAAGGVYELFDHYDRPFTLSIRSGAKEQEHVR